MADCRTWEKNMQDEPGELCDARNESTEKQSEGMCERTQEPTVRAPNRQSWNNLRNEINNIVLDYNSQYKINNHKPILIKIIE